MKGMLTNIVDPDQMPQVSPLFAVNIGILLKVNIEIKFRQNIMG